jgi:periplasmic divalent cation tolerance protein
MWLAYHLFNSDHGKMMCEPYLVITSWPDLDGARQQANHWVENKLAASVNILPQMDSIYVWQGELRNGTEHKIFIKTCASQLAALHSDIKLTHPYAVAEILHIKIDSGDPDYLNWIAASTQ